MHPIPATRLAANTVIGLLLTTALLFPPHSMAREPDRQWQLVNEKNGVRVYRKHHDESRIKTLLGITEIDIANPHSVFAAFTDFEAMPEWMHLVSEIELIQKHSDTFQQVRVVTHLPWPVKDREILLDGEFISPSERFDIEIRMTGNTSLLPPNGDVVRMPEFYGNFGFNFLENGKLEIHYEVNGDPGGYIPPFLVNLLMVDAARLTLYRLPVVARREKYRDAHFDFLLTPDTLVQRRQESNRP